MPDKPHVSDSVYRMLFDRSGDAIFVHDAESILAVNAKACESLGYEEAELLAMKPSDVDTSDEKLKIPDRIARLKSCNTMSFETTHQRKDGSHFPIEVTARLIEWDGRMAVLSICRDLTRRKKAENMLLTTALEWQSTFDSLKDSIFLMDLEYKILRCNKAASEMFGKDGIDIAGRHCLEVVHGTKEPVPGCPMSRMRKTGKREMAQLNSGDRWLEVTVDPVFDEEGGICGAVHVMSDITESKRTEDALRLKNLAFNVAISANSIAGLDGVITEVNDAFIRIWGYGCKEEVIGRNISHFLVNPEEAAAIVKIVDAEGKWEGFYNARKKYGTTFIAHGIATVVRDENGKVVGYQSSVMDVTEQKRIEMEKAMLENQNRQLHKVQSLDRMAGAISHHFNNQLHVVLGNLDMAISGLSPDDPNHEILATAMQAARKASDVSVLLITYLGQKLARREPADLAEICRTSLPVLMAGKPEHVDLEADLPSPGPVISADAKQIQQLLANLVINAWEAIGDKAGTVRLAVRTISPEDITASHRFPVDWRTKKQAYVCLEIMDSGCGIREEDMEKLFDPFFSTKFVGRGLGLSVVLGIVRAHGVAITVENRTGGGSVFSVFFPLSAQTAPGHEEQVAGTQMIPPGGTVLLAEDEDEVRKMTVRMLASLGFKVLQARDGLEAVEIFTQHKEEITLLLSDLKMPRMGGWEAIAALRAVKPDLPVILASGYDEATAMSGDHPEQPEVFLSKPYGKKNLQDAISKAMTGKKGNLG